MDLIAVFSGPKVNGPQVGNAFVGAGFAVQDTENTWGFPATVDGSDPTMPQGFVTVETPDGMLDNAVGIAKQYGFVLRSSWGAQAVKETVSLDGSGHLAGRQKSQEIEARFAALEERVTALEGRD